MMLQLQENELAIIQNYVQVGNTVTEALDYVVASFEDFSKTEGDLVLSDVFAAFAQMLDANGHIIFFLKEDPESLLHVLQFNEMITKIEKLEDIFGQVEQRNAFIKNELVPMYQAWINETNVKLQKYMQA